MILHPDGRVEGTPEELTKFQNLRANRVVIKKTRTIRPAVPVEDPIPQP